MLPILAGATLHDKPHFFKGLPLYDKQTEYGEAHRPKPSAVLTWFNSWSSLGYWYAGVFTLDDIVRRVLDRAPQNCPDAFPIWHVALGLALLWTGAASFLFHASLTERWRMLDAGATMGVTCWSTGATLHRALRSSFGAMPLVELVLFLLASCGFVGCHRLARQRGWSDIVLVGNLVASLIIEWTWLYAYKTSADVDSHAMYVSLMLIGVGLRALDVERRRLPESLALIRRVAWTGHSLWHLLTSAAIVVLVIASNRSVEPFCTSAGTPAEAAAGTLRCASPASINSHPHVVKPQRPLFNRLSASFRAGECRR